MDPKQKKKWEQKLAKARSDDKKTSSELSKGSSANPDLNAIRKRYHAEKDDSTPEDLPLEPDQSVEDDIEVEVKSSKAKSGADADDNLLSKKITIKSKSKGTLGFNG